MASEADRQRGNGSFGIISAAAAAAAPELNKSGDDDDVVVEVSVELVGVILV